MEQTKETKRVLIAWPDFNGAFLLSANNQALVTPEHIAKTTAAQAALKERQALPVPSNIISDPGKELNDYLTVLWQQNPYLVQEGWTVKIADLRGVHTIQPQVEIINSKKRTNIEKKTDVVEIAKISIPLTSPETLSGTFDPIKNAFVFSSPNPNLQILAPQQTPDGTFGFTVGVSNSLVQVVKVNDRYFLRDGHHRAYGFLSNSLPFIPVLYKEFRSIHEMALPTGLFSPETLLSNTPPRLLDFFDETLSGVAEFPRSTKVLVIQGLQIQTT